MNKTVWFSRPHDMRWSLGRNGEVITHGVEVVVALRGTLRLHAVTSKGKISANTFVGIEDHPDTLRALAAVLVERARELEQASSPGSP